MVNKSPRAESFRNAAWRIAALALAPAVGLGIARFAYALVLPDMRADLGWSFAEAGWMNSANAAGYLLGALAAAFAIGRFGMARVIVIGVGTCVLSLLLSAVVRDIPGLSLVRLIAGLGGAFAFVAGGVAAAEIAARHEGRAAFLIGLFYAGPGVGILVSGIAAPTLLAVYGAGSWPLAWLAFGVLALPMAMLAALAAGSGPTPSAAAAQPASALPMAALLWAYGAFGAGYIAYMTFMIAFVTEAGNGPALQAAFWAVIGITAMASPWLWAGVLRTFLHGRAFAFLGGVTALGAALPLVASGPVALLISASIFGGAFFAVVASTTAFVRRSYPPAAWPSAIGRLTVAFGLGQTIGPICVGALNDATGGMATGLWASTALLAGAAGLALLQRDIPIKAAVR